VAFCGNTDIAVAHDTDPFVSAYPWTPGAGFGLKYADPATKPASTGFGVAFTSGGTPKRAMGSNISKLIAAGIL
jgi:hypothetical protein